MSPGNPFPLRLRAMTESFENQSISHTIQHQHSLSRDLHSHLPIELILEVASYLYGRELCHYAAITRTNWTVLRKHCHHMALKLAQPTFTEYKKYLDAQSATMRHRLWQEVSDSDIGARSKFSDAVCKGYTHAVKSFLTHGVSSNTYNIFGNRALTLAGSCPDPLAMSRLLLMNGANPCLTDIMSNQFSPLYCAASMAQDELVMLLIEFGADVKQKNVIHALCQVCKKETVQRAVERGANLHEISENGSNLLHSAARNEDTRVLPFLFGLSLPSAMINGRTSTGKTPLMKAVAAEKPHNVSILLAVGANPGATNGLTALHIACSLGHVEIASLLIEGGANIEAAGLSGIRPLHSALTIPSIEVVRLLVQKGADVAARDILGHCALVKICCKAVEHNYNPDDALEIVKILVAAHASRGAHYMPDHFPVRVALTQRQYEIAYIMQTRDPHALDGRAPHGGDWSEYLRRHFFKTHFP